MAYLGILILIMIIGLLSGSGLGSNVSMSELARSGAAIFSFIAYSQVIAVCLIAPLFMASAIASEQSGQTFNILLTTPLSNMQIVLGSLLGRLFFILSLLASGLPLFSILLLFGGVPIGAIFAAFSIAALVAVVVGSVAVTLAVLRKGGRKAVFVFIIAVTGYLITSYAADRMIRQIRPTAATLSVADAADPLLANELNADALANTNSNSSATTSKAPGLSAGRSPTGQTTWLTPLHPFLVLQASLNDPGYQPPTPEELVNKPWWLQTYLGKPLTTFTALSLFISFILLAFSAIRLRAIGAAAGGGSGWARWLPASLRRKLRLDLGGERRRPPRSVSRNPIAWRESHTRGNATAAIMARVAYFLIGIGIAFVLIAFYHAGLLPTNMGSISDGSLLDQVEIFRFALVTLLLLELGVAAMIAIYTSAGCVSGEREDGTLDLMLTTPITPRFYIWGKLRGLIGFLALFLAVPIVTIAMVCAYVVIGMLLQWPEVYTTYYGTFGQIHAPIILPEAAILLPMVLIPFVALCVAWGMNFSLKRKTVLGAVLCVLPAVAGLVVVAGLCGGGVVNNIPLIGPIINAFSPTTGMIMLLEPWTRVSQFATSGMTGHIILIIAATLAGLGYSLFVYLQINKMVKDFDKNIRELSGA